MFAKWHDGQEGDLGQDIEVQVWSQVGFALRQQGIVVNHASGQKGS